MAPWLFLDDLPPSITSKQLEVLCAPYGKVLWGRVIPDPYGKVSTYAYVEMAKASDAEEAAKALDRTEQLGRCIRAMLTGSSSQDRSLEGTLQA
jgi:RNA recognition motif-containing protein